MYSIHITTVYNLRLMYFSGSQSLQIIPYSCYSMTWGGLGYMNYWRSWNAILLLPHPFGVIRKKEERTWSGAFVDIFKYYINVQRPRPSLSVTAERSLLKMEGRLLINNSVKPTYSFWWSVTCGLTIWHYNLNKNIQNYLNANENNPCRSSLI